MKVLFYIHSFLIGGAETICANYLIEMKKKNIDVEVVVNNKVDTFLEKNIVDNNIKIHEIFSKNDKLLRKICRKFLKKLYLKKLWKEIFSIAKPDVFYINTNLENVYIDFFNMKNVFFSFHTDVNRHFEIFGNQEIQKLKTYSNRGMNFFAISSLIEKTIKDFFNTKNVYKIYNGIDINYLRNNRYDKKTVLRELNINEDAFILGHVGRFHKVKNHEKIIDVFDVLHKIKPNSYLFLIGTGDAFEVEKIKSDVAKRNLNDSVVFFGVRKDANLLMGSFDAFILPSHIEGFSLVLIEAQALGIRSVTSLGIPKDVICNSNVFQLDENESSETWANFLLDNTTRAEHNPIDKFDISYVVDSIIKIFEMNRRS